MAKEGPLTATALLLLLFDVFMALAMFAAGIIAVQQEHATMKAKRRPAAVCRLCGKALKPDPRRGGLCSRCNSYGGPGPYVGPTGHGGGQSKLMTRMPGRGEKVDYYAERAAAHLPLFTT